MSMSTAATSLPSSVTGTTETPTSIERIVIYRATPDSHHDLALVQVEHPEQEPPVARWSMAGTRAGINHIAITYPNRDEFLRQLEHLSANGVEFLVRGDHGMFKKAISYLVWYLLRKTPAP
mgnify:CR=1 FL=1